MKGLVSTVLGVVWEHEYSLTYGEREASGGDNEVATLRDSKDSVFGDS